jgi:hypothetical protein
MTVQGRDFSAEEAHAFDQSCKILEGFGSSQKLSILANILAFHIFDHVSQKGGTILDARKVLRDIAVDTAELIDINARGAPGVMLIKDIIAGSKTS